jgi:hypothetical protein
LELSHFLLQPRLSIAYYSTGKIEMVSKKGIGEPLPVLELAGNPLPVLLEEKFRQDATG